MRFMVNFLLDLGIIGLTGVHLPVATSMPSRIGLGLPLDGILALPPHYDPQQYARNEPVLLGNDLSWDSLSEEYLNNSSDSNSSIASSTRASTLYPGSTFPVRPPRDNNIPSDLPGHLDISAMDSVHAFTETWTLGVDNGLLRSCELSTQLLDNEYRQVVH